MLISVKLLAKYVIIIYALSSASESKPFQSRSKCEIPGRARRKERLSLSKLKQAFLTDSNAELLVMYLIQCQVRLMKRTASEPGLTVRLVCKQADLCEFWENVGGIFLALPRFPRTPTCVPAGQRVISSTQFSGMLSMN